VARSLHSAGESHRLAHIPYIPNLASPPVHDRLCGTVNLQEKVTPTLRSRQHKITIRNHRIRSRLAPGANATITASHSWLRLIFISSRHTSIAQPLARAACSIAMRILAKASPCSKNRGDTCVGRASLSSPLPNNGTGKAACRCVLPTAWLRAQPAGTPALVDCSAMDEPGGESSPGNRAGKEAAGAPASGWCWCGRVHLLARRTVAPLDCVQASGSGARLR